MKRLIFILLLLTITAPLYAQPSVDIPQIAQLGRGTAEALDWHPDGHVLAVGGSHGLWLYDESLADLAYIPDTGAIKGLAWSPTGDHLATTDGDTVSVWRITSDPYTLTLKHSWVFEGIGLSPRMAWSPDGQRVAILTSQGTEIFDSVSGESLLTIPDLISTMRWRSDSTQIAGSVDLGNGLGEHIRVWDANTGEVIKTYLGVESGLYWSAIDWSPDKSTLVGVTGIPATLHAWDVESGQLLNAPDPSMGDTSAILDIWWLDDGTKLVTSDSAVHSGSVVFMSWDVSTWTPQSDYQRMGYAWQSAKRPNMDEWATISVDGQLMIWDLEQDTPLHIRSVHSYPPGLLRWSPDSHYLASAAISRIEVWDVSEMTRPTSQAMSDTDIRLEVHDLRWHDDNGLIGLLENNHATYIYDVVVQWDSTTGEFLDTINEFGSDWNPDYSWNSDFSKVAYRAYDRTQITIAAVDKQDNGRISPGEDLVSFNVDKPVQTVWSPDNTMLAVISRDEQAEVTAAVYDAVTGQLINRLMPSFYSNLYELTWSPDSRLLAFTGRCSIAGSGETEYRLDVLEIERSSEVAAHVTTILDVGTKFLSAWHPNSQLLAVTTSAGIGIYPVSPEQNRTAIGVTVDPTVLIPEVHVYALDWSPDGMLLAGGHQDGTIRIWDVSAVND